MELQVLKDKINYLIDVKGVQPKYFWKHVGAERSMFCRWRKNENRKLSESVINELEKMIIDY